MTTLALFALLSCTPSDEASSADSDAADADTDTDTDSDTDTDTDSDTDADCDDRDLTFVAQTRDGSGNCSGCSSPVEISGVVQNRCTGPVEYDTATQCLVRSATVRVKGGSDVHTASSSCEATPKTWTLQADQSVPEVIIPSLSLGTGEYEVVITFNDARPNEALKTFAVE